jgi:hypothetical protein
MVSVWNRVSINKTIALLRFVTPRSAKITSSTCERGLTSNFLCGGGMDVFWNDCGEDNLSSKVNFVRELFRKITS